jgi:hypothetical protein
MPWANTIAVAVAFVDKSHPFAFYVAMPQTTVGFGIEHVVLLCRVVPRGGSRWPGTTGVVTREAV